jgi:hypothetical protein
VFISVFVGYVSNTPIVPWPKSTKRSSVWWQVWAGLDEKNRRRFVGLLALQWGHGGIARLIEITRLSRNTICRGRVEVQQADRATAERVRCAGAGRPALEKNSHGS